MTAATEMRKAVARLATSTVRIRTATGQTAGTGDPQPTYSTWTTYAAQIKRPTTAERAAMAEQANVDWIVTIPDASVTLTTSHDPRGLQAQVELLGSLTRPVVTWESVRAPESDEQLALRIMVS